MLIVDHDDAFRNGLAGMLRDDAHDVTDVATSADVSLADQLPRVSLVIAEYLLPGEHGLAFADRCRRVRADVPVLLLSTSVTRSVRLQVEVRPAVCALAKPVAYEDLHAWVHALARQL